MSAPVIAYEGKLYRREGECCRCGECCRGNPFDGPDTEYCPLFRWLEEGVGECTDREHPYYLNGCNVFPSHPGQIADKPSCSYRFVEVDP